MKFIRNTKYYEGVVYEWNLPAGHTCPQAKECLVKVGRWSGAFENKSHSFRCYAASAERFPSVRAHRWANYHYVRYRGIPVIPKKAENIRIHASGDFFSQRYFDMWLKLCEDNPKINFWAFTKSLLFWINRINDIPDNLILTASWGGKEDYLIDEHKLKNVQVISSSDGVEKELIDVNDDLARIPDVNFYLLDNNNNNKKRKDNK